jgi:hypothetical protein
MSDTNISGSYIYRSLLNDKSVQTEFSDLEFGRGVMNITHADGVVKGTFSMGEGFEMTMEGTVFTTDKKSYLKMTGYGVPGTATDKWVYDYVGLVVPVWPNAVKQVSTITGSVIRTADHGQAKAGATATFYMVLTN